MTCAPIHKKKTGILPRSISSTASIIYVPESPVWLLAEGRHEKALQILRQAAIVNGKDASLLFPPGTVLDTVEDENDARNYVDLLKPRMRKTTLLLTGKSLLSKQTRKTELRLVLVFHRKIKRFFSALILRSGLLWIHNRHLQHFDTRDPHLFFGREGRRELFL